MLAGNAGVASGSRKATRKSSHVKSGGGGGGGRTKVVRSVGRAVSSGVSVSHVGRAAASGAHLGSHLGRAASGGVAVASVSAGPSRAAIHASRAAARASRQAARKKRRQKQKARGIRKAQTQLASARRAISKQQKALSKPLPGLSAHETKVAEKFLSSGVKQGASRKQLLSGIETGLVESGFHNLAGGEGSSVGVRQETAESYPSVNRRNIRAAGRRYFSEAKAADVGQSAGELAQAVQRSAYPSRYAEVKPQAKPILKAYVHRVKKVGGKNLVPKGPMKAKSLPGPYDGAQRAVGKALKGISSPKGGKRTPAENAAVGGSPTSDHLTTNKRAYAKDIPATGAKGTRVAQKVAANLGIKNFSPGSYSWYTSPKAPGYRFQILWQVEGHFDHVHVGAEYVGAGASGSTVPATGASTATGSSPASAAAAGAAIAASSGAVGKGESKVVSKEQAKRLRKRQAEGRRRRRAAGAIGRYRRGLTPVQIAVAQAVRKAPVREKIRLGL